MYCCVALGWGPFVLFCFVLFGFVWVGLGRVLHCTFIVSVLTRLFACLAASLCLSVYSTCVYVCTCMHACAVKYCIGNPSSDSVVQYGYPCEVD